MNKENAGYTLTTIVELKEVAIVIGHNPKAPSPYVCWMANKELTSFFWGRYCGTWAGAWDYLLERVDREAK